MNNKIEDDDGLYNLINLDDTFDNDSETCRTDDLLFDNNRINWNRVRVYENNVSLTQNSHINGNVDSDALKLMNNNGGSSDPFDSQGLSGLSARSKFINERVEKNLNIYLPHNLRNSICNGSVDTKYSMCHGCKKNNKYGLGWCSFCGELLIEAHKQESRMSVINNDDCEKDTANKDLNLTDATHLYNGTVMWRPMDVEEIDNKSKGRIETKNVKLDLVGLETVRTSKSEDWDFELEVNEELQSASNNNPIRHVVVPPLDLSVLDSSRRIHNAPKLNDISIDESKENCSKPLRKWATSSSAWVDIPESMLQKKPSTYYRNKLNSCTNKIGITVYRTGMEDDVDFVSSVSPVKNVVKIDESIVVDSRSPVRRSDLQKDISPVVVSELPAPILIGSSLQNDIVDGVISQWQCLPAEIWIKVMTYLSHHQLSHLQQTCRRVYSIGLDSSLWRSINLYRHSTLSNEHISYIARKTPKELHFKNCFGTNITSNGLVGMFKVCGDGLRKISFISCSKGAFEDDLFLELSSIFCPNVTHINASYLMNLRDDTLKKMIEGFVKIESLNIMGAHSISNKSIKSLIDRHRTTLINLDLYGCFKLNSLTLTLLEECFNLRSLALGSINNLKRTSLIDMLKKLSQLTILDLRGTMNLVDDSLLENICQSCPKLQQIILTNSCRLTDQGVIGLAKSCVSSSLKILDICGCSKITERGLEMVLKQCQELEDLDISCTGIRGDGAKFFRMYLPPKLRCLRINNNKFISTDELLSLIRSCKKLTTIYMCGTTSIGSWRPIEEQFPHITFKHE